MTDEEGQIKACLSLEMGMDQNCLLEVKSNNKLPGAFSLFTTIHTSLIVIFKKTQLSPACFFLFPALFHRLRVHCGCPFSLFELSGEGLSDLELHVEAYGGLMFYIKLALLSILSSQRCIFTRVLSKQQLCHPFVAAQEFIASYEGVTSHEDINQL